MDWTFAIVWQKKDGLSQFKKNDANTELSTYLIADTIVLLLWAYHDEYWLQKDLQFSKKRTTESNYRSSI